MDDLGGAEARRVGARGKAREVDRGDPVGKLETAQGRRVVDRGPVPVGALLGSRPVE